MESTARNMWKVIYDRKCGAVVMLSDLVENGKVKHSIVLCLLRKKDNSCEEVAVQYVLF